MSIAIRQVVAAAVLAAATSSQAGIVTFTPLTSPSQGPAGDGITYAEAGLTFTSSVANSNALFHWGSADSANADPGGATLFQNFVGQFLTVTQTGGGAFVLNSFDLADAFNSGSPSVIPFSYVDGSGTHNSSLTLDSLVGLETFNFGFAVTSFSLQQVSPYFQLDNVVFNRGAVPEPGTWALAGISLLGLAMTSRRRTR